jgi:hypothetical protein
MGIIIQLAEGMKLGEDIQTKHMCLIDEQDGDLFLAGDIGEKSADKGQHLGGGIGGGRVAEEKTNHPEGYPPRFIPQRQGTHRHDRPVCLGLQQGGKAPYVSRYG